MRCGCERAAARRDRLRLRVPVSADRGLRGRLNSINVLRVVLQDGPKALRVTLARDRSAFPYPTLPRIRILLKLSRLSRMVMP